MDRTQIWSDIQKKEQALNSIVSSTIKQFEDTIKSATGVPKVWSHHHGAIGIDPKHLFVYFVLPKRADVTAFKKSCSWNSICSELLRSLASAGYPTSSLQAEWVDIFSEQECTETCNGNWYYFFK